MGVCSSQVQTKILPLNSIQGFRFSLAFWKKKKKQRLPIYPSDKVLPLPAREEKGGGPWSTWLLHAALRSRLGRSMLQRWGWCFHKATGAKMPWPARSACCRLSPSGRAALVILCRGMQLGRVPRPV